MVSFTEFSITDTDDVKNYRFKYVRFIEYLVALHIIREVSQSGTFSMIDDSIRIIYDSNIASIYGVLNNIKHIFRTQYTEIERDVIDYYSHSEAFLSSYLPELRGKIARGEIIGDESIKSILTNNFTQSASSSWNTFFIVAAKNVLVKKDLIMAAFIQAWESNANSPQRWKMLVRLASRGMLLEEKVLFSILKDGQPREWEEYLGTVLENDLRVSFIALWQQIHGDSMFGKIGRKDPNEWQFSKRLLDLIYRNNGYVRGDMFSDDIVQTEYVTFERLPAKRLPILKDDDKAQCETILKEISQALSSQTTINFYSPFVLKEISKEMQLYLSIKLEPFINTSYLVNDKPFFNYIVSEAPRFNSLLRLLKNMPFLDVPLNEVDKDRRTLFQEVVECDQEDKIDFLEMIMGRGYKKTNYDWNYINERINNSKDLSSKEFEDALIGNCFLKLKNEDDYKKFNQVYREVFVLLTAKYNRVIYFKFPNLLQVANNALEHYRDYRNLFIKGFSYYGRYDTLIEKPSFRKKVETLAIDQSVDNQEFVDVFSAIFPELFQ